MLFVLLNLFTKVFPIGDAQWGYSNDKSVFTFEAKYRFFEISGGLFILMGIVLPLLLFGTEKLFANWFLTWLPLFIGLPFITVGLIFIFGKKKRRSVRFDKSKRIFAVNDGKEIPSYMIARLYFEHLQDVRQETKAGGSYHLMLRMTNLKSVKIASSEKLNDLKEIAGMIKNHMNVMIDYNVVEA